MAGQLSQECEPYILPLFQDHSEALMGKDVSWLCKALGIYNLFTTLIYNIEKFLNELFMTTSSVETFPAVDSGGFNFRSIYLTNIILFYKKAHPLTNNE